MEVVGSVNKVITIDVRFTVDELNTLLADIKAVVNMSPNLCVVRFLDKFAEELSCKTGLFYRDEDDE